MIHRLHNCMLQSAMNLACDMDACAVAAEEDDVDEARFAGPGKWCRLFAFYQTKLPTLRTDDAFGVLLVLPSRCLTET